ncbi:hypothetical protein [Oceanobacillus jeddahense]|uniref:LPXTG cell wall anchor domain-containing protein n=1 Tax=Oceanobacillus jeddahense TaxID=1462527 RepID=A0ABY5K215_9BACI|nr:hypothetical protein [Oceanobacillus jeddahense]UUI05393.1 hypothetical protein NP439_12425 [Oceanobacillus jeddahense]
MTHLFTNDSDETAIFDRVQCQGGGLETIYMTSHFSDHTKNRFIIIISIATPILAGIGFILYRRNKRKPVKKY